MGSAAFWIAVASAALASALLIFAGIALVRIMRPRGDSLDPRRERQREREPPAPAPPEGASPELAQAFARAQAEARRARQLAVLASTLELDEVLAQLLDAAASACAADGAAIALANDRGDALVKTLNLSPEEGAPSLDALRHERRARALTMHYRYPTTDVPTRADPIRSGLVVPLIGAAEEPIGTLAVYWRREGHQPSDDQVAALEELALSSSRAIENARQFKKARELAVLDGLTSLYNRAHFHEVLAREVKRAHRYDRNLALVLMDLDNFKAINDQIGHLGGDRVLAEVAERLRSVVRGADIPCRDGGDEFAVVMPESALIDARQLYERLRLAIEGQPIGRAERLQLSAGTAELQRDDDSVSLFQRADQALFRAKRAGKGQLLAPNDDQRR